MTPTSRNPDTQVGRQRKRRLAVRLLRLYPHSWRDRYGEEVGALIAQHPVRTRSLLNLMLGAADAWTHPGLVRGTEQSLSLRVRTSHLVVMSASALFTLALIGLLHGVHDPGPEWQSVTGRSPGIRSLVNLVEAIGGVTVLVALFSFVVVLGSTARQALSAMRWDVLRPLIGFGTIVMVWLACSVAVVVEASSRPGIGIRPLRMIDVIVELLWFLGTLAAAVGATVCLRRVLIRGELTHMVMRIARVTTAAIAVAMAATLLTTVVGGILMLNQQPNLLDAGSLAVVAAMMAVATVLTALAFHRSTGGYLRSPAGSQR